jgi:hypothetical protein
MQPFIYGLVDPAEPKHVRYVGMTLTRKKRPYDHAKNARNGSKRHPHLLNWVRKIQSEGREYDVLVLEQLSSGISRSLAGFAEQCYIKSLREIGHDLTNATIGGDGGDASTGRVRSAEARAKYSIAQKASWAKRKAASNGCSLGHPWSKEARAKLSATKMGSRASEETRKILSAAHLGSLRTEGSKAKQSATLKELWAKRKDGEATLTPEQKEELAERRREATRRGWIVRRARSITGEITQCLS